MKNSDTNLVRNYIFNRLTGVGSETNFSGLQVPGYSTIGNF